MLPNKREKEKELLASGTQFNLNTFSEWIEKNIGLYFPKRNQIKLSKKILQRAKELSLEDFSEYFNYCQKESSEIEFLKNYLTTRETYFFRSFKIVQALIKEKIKSAKNSGIKQKLKIVSLGCATGEEVYSIAMYHLHELGLKPILKGFDLSGDAIDIASNGKYLTHTVRNLSGPYLEYFRTEGDYISVDDKIKKMASFAEFNLLNLSKYSNIRHCDFVLCRNTLLYFSEERRQEILANIFARIKTGGALILGKSESISIENVQMLFITIRDETQKINLDIKSIKKLLKFLD